MKESKRKKPRNEGEATEMSVHSSKGTPSELVGERTEEKAGEEQKTPQETQTKQTKRR